MQNKMKIDLKLVFQIVFAISFIIAEKSFAQAPPLSHMDWFTVGLGVGPDKNISGTVNYTIAGENLYLLSFNTNFDGSVLRKIPSLYVESFGVSFGKQIENDFGILAAYAGPALVLINERYMPHKYLPGLNIESQIIYNPIPEFGFGVDGYMNINSFKTVGGIRFVLFLRALQ